MDILYDSAPSKGDATGETRSLLQGDYVLPNVHHTILTSHTMVEGSEGDTSEIMEGDMYSYRDGRPAVIVSSTSWYGFDQLYK